MGLKVLACHKAEECLSVFWYIYVRLLSVFAEKKYNFCPSEPTSIFPLTSGCASSAIGRVIELNIGLYSQFPACGNEMELKLNRNVQFPHTLPFTLIQTAYGFVFSLFLLAFIKGTQSIADLCFIKG